MKTHPSLLGSAVAAVLSVAALNVSAAAETATAGATPPPSTAGGAQAPTTSAGPGAAMNPEQAPPMGPGRGHMWGPGGGHWMGPGQGRMGPGWGRGNRQRMQQRWAMMQSHVQAVENRLANIEALLRELVQLQKGQKTH
jgi:hypothetical protein